MKTRKRKPEIAFEDVKILQQEQRFKAKRDEQLLKKLDIEKDNLEYWFANTHSDLNLKVHLVLSRKFEELEVRKELKYYGSNKIIALTDTVDSHTWYNPYLMEKYIDSFFETHKRSIELILQYHNNYK